MTDRYAALSLDEAADRAPRGQSHFHASLLRNQHLFRCLCGHDPTRADFAAAAFVCATTPKMVAPYVTRHPRVISAEPRRDPNGTYALRIQLALDPPHPAIEYLPPVYLDRGWQIDPATGEFYQPTFHDYPTSVTTGTIDIPMPDDVLPDPAYTLDVPALQPARHAVRVLATHASALIRPVLLALDPDHPA